MVLALLGSLSSEACNLVNLFRRLTESILVSEVRENLENDTKTMYCNMPDRRRTFIKHTF